MSAIQPRQWQTQLIQLLRRRLDGEATGEQDVLVFAGPGAGKTLGALLAFRSMRQEQRLQHFLVFCHRTSILEQWQRSAARVGLELVSWPCEQKTLNQADGLLLTYQSAGRQPQQLERSMHRHS